MNSERNGVVIKNNILVMFNLENYKLQRNTNPLINLLSKRYCNI